SLRLTPPPRSPLFPYTTLFRSHKAYGGQRKVTWREVLAGEKAFKSTGNWLPQETLDVIAEHLVAIKGPLTTPVGGGIRSLNVALDRKSTRLNSSHVKISYAVFC